MRKSTVPLLIFISFILGILKIHAEDSNLEPGTQEFLLSTSPWVDSVFNSLSKDGKNRHSSMVAAHSYLDEPKSEALERLSAKEPLGGIVFLRGGTLRQTHLPARYPYLLKVPALVAMA